MSPSLTYYCRYFLIIVGSIRFSSGLILVVLRAVVGRISHLELGRVARPPSLLFISWCIRGLGVPVNVCLCLLHAPWLMFRLQTHIKVLSQSPIRSVRQRNR